MSTRTRPHTSDTFPCRFAPVHSPLRSVDTPDRRNRVRPPVMAERFKEQARTEMGRGSEFCEREQSETPKNLNCVRQDGAQITEELVIQTATCWCFPTVPASTCQWSRCLSTRSSQVGTSKCAPLTEGTSTPQQWWRRLRGGAWILAVESAQLARRLSGTCSLALRPSSRLSKRSGVHHGAASAKSPQAAGRVPPRFRSRGG